MVTGGKAGAATVMSAAALGAVYVFWYHNPPTEFESTRPGYLGAMIIGAFVGWTHLGSRLGKGFFHSILVAVTAGAFGLLYFLALASLRGIILKYRYSSYQTMMELLNDIVARSVDGFFEYMQIEVVVALLMGAVIAGILSEWYNIIWD